METKTSKVVTYWEAGMIKEALAIVKTFRIGFTTEERRKISITYECLCGHSLFYESVGIDCEQIKKDCISIIESKYGRQESDKHIQGMASGLEPVCP